MGPEIRVIGVGGGGSNAISHMIDMGVSGVDFIAVDTDVQKLSRCRAEHKLAIGQTVTRGLGTGGNQALGQEAAEQSHKEIKGILEKADMVFVTAGLGGGTGTGAVPVIAGMARSLGALTVGVVTTPFHFERQRRMRAAQAGIAALRDQVDAIVVIHNQRLFEIVDARTSIKEAFALVDEILRQAVQGMSDLITVPGTINVDFADVRSVLQGAGPVLMGVSTGPSDRPAADLVKAAVASPLLENGIQGATEILLNVYIGPDTSLHQVYAAADAVAEAAGTPSPNVIFGAVVDPQMRGKMGLTIIAAGFGQATEPLRLPEGRAQPHPLPSVRPAPEPDPGPILPPLDFEEEENMPSFVKRRRRQAQQAAAEEAMEAGGDAV